jgi:predicted RNA-binding protein YlqC (UPF0109 family)
MEELLKYLVENITGNSKIKISKSEEEGNVNFTIKPPDDVVGLIIGKAGKTIKAISSLLKVRATLEKKRVNVEVIS